MFPAFSSGSPQDRVRGDNERKMSEKYQARGSEAPSSTGLSVVANKPDMPSWLETLSPIFSQAEAEAFVHAIDFCLPLYGEDSGDI